MSRQYHKQILRELVNTAIGLKTKVVQRVREHALLKNAKRLNCAGSFDFLFFCPEAAVVPHYSLMRYLAILINEMGYKAVGVGCWRLYDRCPSISAVRLPALAPQKARWNVCSECLRQSSHGSDAFNLPKLWLPTFWNPETQNKLSGAMAVFDRDPFGPLYDGIEFGKIATLDVSLATKAYDYQRLSDDQRVLWRQLVESAVTSYLLVSEIYSAHQFTHFVYFNDYAPNLGGALSARNNGCKIVAITQASNQNIDRRKVVIRNTFTVEYLPRLHHKWPLWRGLALPTERIEQIAQDTILRWQGKGSHVYSPPPQANKKALSKKKTVKRVVAFTSSLDEISAAFVQTRALIGKKSEYELCFGSDITTFHLEWIQALFEWAATKSDMELIVRIHPREGANKRESERSEHLQNLVQGLPLPPSNCRVVWPEEQQSSYELGEQANVVLTSWSTIGLEFARLGVPVLTATNGLSGFVNEKFHRFARGKTEYFNELEKLLSCSLTLQDIVMAYRFWNFYILASAIELDDVIPSADHAEHIAFSMPERALDIVRCLSGEREALDVNHSAYEARQTPAAYQSELDSVRRCSLDIVASILGVAPWTRTPTCTLVSEHLTSSERMALFDAMSTHNCNMEKPAITAIGSTIFYTTNGQLESRESVLIRRLLEVIAE